MADGAIWNQSVRTSLDSRFLRFRDEGIWHSAPLLTGQTCFEPLPDVRNILVTGGEGFIGSWLVRHLTIKYPNAYNVVSFDKLDYCSSLNNARMLERKANFDFFHGDVTQPSDVLRCLKKHIIDTVFHLAAHTHVDLSFGNSYNFTKNNVLGTHVLLESIKEYGKVKRFYHISTDEVYGEALAADLAESSTLDPSNPYSASKAAAEMIVKGYVKSHKLPAVVIRLNNVMGPHQYPEKVIPKFINLLRRQMPLLLHGDGQHTRRYLYAGDAAEAFDTILHKGEIGQIYNVDSRDEISNIGLAEKLLNLFGLTDKSTWIQHTHDRKFNDRRYAVDGSKLRQLGWEQRTKFEDALAATVDWYGKFENWFGDIEGVLTAHPVVKGDHVEPESDFAPAGHLCNDVEAIVGATSSGIVHTKEHIAVPNGVTNGSHVNGAKPGVEMQTGAKKRKADVMTEA
ncbi:hypothetical protein B0A48_16774 [Cryoendolithus antarcticus]|uniref:NAD(P)-binding domain-containing protein n=1 Tax=Cryoendolithus antarcticus TaxID=1507870 RepID=A0A1V8SDJ9_9PEZI|nr:hypothetical protein B0A48_16774 [Cryoendolithus antarcticus]